MPTLQFLARPTGATLRATGGGLPINRAGDRATAMPRRVSRIGASVVTGPAPTTVSGLATAGLVPILSFLSYLR